MEIRSVLLFFFSSRRRHTKYWRDWSSDVCSSDLLRGEWEDVVDAWQLDTWEAYRDVRRLGRKTRLPEAQRAALWGIFERVRDREERRVGKECRSRWSPYH